MFGRCVDLIGRKVLDRILFVLSLFLGDHQLHVSKLGDGKLLRPDVVSFVIDATLNCVDALCQRIDADFFASITHFSVAPKWPDPVFAVGFDMFWEVRIMGEP